MELIIAGGVGLLLGAGALSVVQALKRSSARALELRVRSVINKCFQKSGLEIEVSCIKQTKGLLVFIESEPSKKLRFSYIKEQALVQHIERTTGQTIERIFWRFRMRNKEETSLNAPVNTETMFEAREDACDERKPLSARKTDFEVDEIAWDNFAEHVHQQAAPAITTTQFNRLAEKAA